MTWPSWTATAACTAPGVDPAWFDGPTPDPRAVACCDACPVRVQCLTWALEMEAGLRHDFRGGYVGGMGAQGRARLGGRG